MKVLTNVSRNPLQPEDCLLTVFITLYLRNNLPYFFLPHVIEKVEGFLKASGFFFEELSYTKCEEG